MSSTAFRSEAAVASVLAGVSLFVGHGLGGTGGGVGGGALVLSAHVLLVVALLGAGVAQYAAAGRLGRAGALLATLATVVVSAIVFVELAGAAGAPAAAVLGTPATALLAAVGPLAFVLGLVAFGVATARAGVLPRSAGGLLVVGTVVFAAGTLAGPFADVVTLVGAGLTGAGLVVLGVGLARLPTSPVDASESPTVRV